MIARPESEAGSAKYYSLSVFIMVLYAFWLFATPYNRFPILTAISAEKLLVFFSVLSIIFEPTKGKLNSAVTGWFIFCLVIMYISYFSSVYGNVPGAQGWSSVYWKIAVLYFLMVLSFNSLERVEYFLVGVFFLVALYQLNSMLDFMRGGSYVYQQGMKRMGGNWMAGGYGVGNAWGFLGILNIALGVYVYSFFSNKRYKRLVIFFLVLSFACVILSGSRGSMAALFLWGGWVYRKQIFKLKYLALLPVLLSILYLNLEDEYKQRYFGSFSFSEGSDEGSHAVAAESADSRLAGFIEGILMANNKPILGYGPGTSAWSRVSVDSEYVGLQMHSLYGQGFGELGYIGFGVCLIFWWRIFSNMRKLSILDNSESGRFRRLAIFVRDNLVLIMLYGFASHNLYHYRWIWVYALASAAMTLYAQNNEKPADRS